MRSYYNNAINSEFIDICNIENENINEFVLLYFSRDSRFTSESQI